MGRGSWNWESPNPGAGGAAGGDLVGDFPAPTVAKLRGRTVHTTTPTDGQVYAWSQANSRWEPATIGGSDATSIQGKAISVNDPTGGQVLQWDSGEDEWVPTSRGTVPLTGQQGEVLYHNGTAWTALGVGTSGQFLRSNGSGAAPSWAFAPNSATGCHVSPLANVYAWTAGMANTVPSDVGPCRVVGAGNFNFKELVGVDYSAGTTSYRVYKGDGDTYSSTTATRTIGSGSGRLTSSGAISDVAVADGDFLIMKCETKTGTVGPTFFTLIGKDGAVLNGP